MSDLRELYQEMIIDHGRHPRNFYVLENANYYAEGFNPLCGDKLTLYLEVKDNKVLKASFKGVGCAISTASASLMTEAIVGKTLTEVENLFTSFHHLVTEEGASDDVGKLKILAGVREFPTRVKCATLPWHTLRAALYEEKAPVSTES